MKKIFLFLTLMAAIVSCKNGLMGPGANPFFETEWDTPYGVPPFDKIDISHYRPAFDTAMVRHLAEIDAITANPAEPDFQNTILALDNSGEMLNKVSYVFFNVTQAETNDELQAIEEEITPRLTAHGNKVSMNEALFERIKKVHETMDSKPYDAAQKRLIEKTYKNLVRGGALLTGEARERYKAVCEELSKATLKFGNNLLADNKSFVLELDSSQIGGLLASSLNAAEELAASEQKPGKYLFTLDKPSLIPFITNSTERELRKTLYEGYLGRCNYDDKTDNKQVINDIVRLRTEKAHLLGYKSHADYVLDNEMAKTPANVYGLLNEMWTPALNSAKKELEEMQAIKLKETGSDDFESWDWWFYAEKVRKEKYALDEEMLRPYFPLDGVRSGIFNLSNRLFGITFKPLKNAPVYHKDCQVYEVLDKDNSHLAVIYLDFFPRKGKRGGAWCTTFNERYYVDGKKVDPVVSIVCNFTPPQGETPALLNLDETETFFHEFGHALHAFFTDTPYKGLAGVERDFVELPSQIMENWAMEPEVLRQYACHYASGAVIPDHLIDKITKSALFNQGFMTTELLAASLSDMDIHSMEAYAPIDVNEFEYQNLNVKHGLIPQIAPRYRYPYFSHIFDGGYSAGYYGYTWAAVLDKDAFAAFKETGDIFNHKVATAFRQEILAKGGMEDGMVLYRNFRGQEPSRIPLLKSRGLIPQDTVDDQAETEIAQ